MPTPSEPQVPLAEDCPAVDDPALIDALQRGEDGAYERLVSDHAGPMLAIAKRMLGNDEDARYALQDAFVNVFRAIGTFERKCRLSTWLHRIVVNSVLMKLRGRRQRPSCSIDDLVPRFTDDGHHVHPPCPFSDAAVRSLQAKENHAVLWHAIDQLPDAYREVIVLRDIEQLSTDETGLALGVTANAVKIRLHRARQALRTLLGDTFEDQHELP